MVIAPLIIPLLMALLMILVPGPSFLLKLMAICGSFFLMVSALFLALHVHEFGPQVMQLGHWPAPYGVSFVADRLSVSMVLITSVLALATMAYGQGEVDERFKQQGYFSLLYVLLAGANGSYLTGDLFNLFVWFEVMLMASFVLLIIGKRKSQLSGAVVYVVFSILSSSLLLAAIGLVFGLTGTLNMAHLAVRLGQMPSNFLVKMISLLFLLALGLKAGIFPLFFWLPDSYPRALVTTSAVFAGILTKAGVYALLRIFTLLFPEALSDFSSFILVLSALTMVIGVLGAAGQEEFRAILSFHIISQIGYMTMGLGLFTVLGLGGAIFFMAHNMLVKTNLFFMSGLAEKLSGKRTLKHMGGLYREKPLLSFLFCFSAFSLTGLPPLSGFWGKLVLAKAGLLEERYVIVGISLLVSLLTLFSMMKIWIKAFWSERQVSMSLLARLSSQDKFPWQMGAIFILTLATALMGGFPNSFLQFTRQAAYELMDKQIYIEAVLGGGR